MKSIISFCSDTLVDFESRYHAMHSNHGKPALAILFVNADLDIEGLNKFLIAKEVLHIGASTAGEICDDKFDHGLYSGIFFYISEDAFKLYHVPISNTSGSAFGNFIKQSFDQPAVYSLIASKSIETDLLIKEIQELNDLSIPLYGGLAMDNLKFEKYTVFNNAGMSHNGLVAVVFDRSKVDLVGDAYSGWESLGLTHTVTASVGNELFEIDGQAAADVFLGYFNYFDVEKLSRGEEVEFSVGNHPIMVDEDTGAQSIKSPVELDIEKKSLKFYSSIPVGTKFKFCTMPDISISEKLVDRLESLKSDFGVMDGIIVTSCVGRNLTLGPFFEDEIKSIFDIWNIPMTGFLSGGEIGNPFESGISCFHNVSSIITGFRLH